MKEARRVKDNMFLGLKCLLEDHCCWLPMSQSNISLRTKACFLLLFVCAGYLFMFKVLLILSVSCYLQHLIVYSLGC